MTTNKMEIYMEATKKQIRALEKGIELLMLAESKVDGFIPPAVDTTELEKALQQEKDLRVKAESSKEDIKRRFKESFEQEQSLRVKAESATEEFKRKFEEAMAELTKEREAHQADNIKWAAEVGRSMKKDEQIEDLQETIEMLKEELASAQTTNKELERRLQDGLMKYKQLQSAQAPVKRTPDKRKDDKAIKANIKQQITAVEEQEVPDMPAQQNIPPINEDEVPDMNTWVHPNPKFRLFVTFQKGCANCPFVNTCSVQNQKSSKIGKNCGLRDMKKAAVNATELHVKVSTKGNKYLYPAFTKEGVYVGDIHKNRENKKAIAILQDHEGKTVVFQTTPDNVVVDSVFTKYEAEVLDVIDNVDEEPVVDTAPVDTSNAVDASDLVFKDMSADENENTNEEETVEKILNGLEDLGEPISALF